MNNLYSNIITKLFNITVKILDKPNEKKILSFLKKNLSDDIIIIDVGAHKGESIKFYNKNFKVNKIYSFEPNKKICEMIRKKNFKNTEVFNLGLGNKNEAKYLNIYKDTFSSSFNQIDKSSNYFKKKKIFSFDNYFENKVLSKLITLSKFINNHKISKIDLLKIDTEGYEFRVLQGIEPKDFTKIKYIHFEHHYNDMLLKNYTFSDIHFLLIRNNFKKKYKLKMNFRKSFEYIYENYAYKS